MTSEKYKPEYVYFISYFISYILLVILLVIFYRGEKEIFLLLQIIRKNLFETN